jgi:putative aminopeptidase FrvX
LVHEQFHRDELMQKSDGLKVDPLMELLIEEEEGLGGASVTEGPVESAMAVSDDLIPEGAQEDIGDEATATGNHMRSLAWGDCLISA